MKKIVSLVLFLFGLNICLIAQAQEISKADELAKWKQLYDSGVITEEEFIAQKNYLLDTSTVLNEKKDDENAVKISKLINEDLEKNKFEIKKLSGTLSFSQREQIYHSNEKSAGGYFALNLILGCGIGSFCQGDVSNGFLALLFELGGLFLAVNGAESQNQMMYALGIGFIAGGRAGECIAPFEYAKKYNDSLYKALYSNNTAFEPVLVIQDDRIGFGARISLN